MADELNYNGLTTSTFDELLTQVQDGLSNMYGQDGQEIDFDTNSPDGQFSNLLATMGQVVRELATLVFNATDPDKCDGSQQDTKYALNYCYRKGGDYTIQPIAITANQTVFLQGLDGSEDNSTSTVYTVSDDSGNLWYLEDSTTIYAGTTTLEFRAANEGAVVPTIGTITTPITIIGGIINVVNNVGYVSLGSEQETDEEFRLRRNQSTTNTSASNFDTIIGNILALDNVTACRGVENNTNSTDSTGTEAHTVWVVVEGGANSEIAQILYGNLAGSNSRGDVEVEFNNVAGQTLTMRFDRPNYIAYYVKFDLLDLSGGYINETSIVETTAENLEFNLGQNVDIATVYQAVQIGIESQNATCYAQNLLISTGGTATASTTSETITSVNVVSNTFQDAIESDTAGDYVFTYDGENWSYNSDNIDLASYGITFEGTAATDDTITITFTAGEWVSLLEVSTIQDLYITDSKKIYITVVE